VERCEEEVRRVLDNLPHQAWREQAQWTAADCYPAYARMGEQWLPRRILEVGAFEGYGLISFWLGAGPQVQRLDWIDAETYAPGTNGRCRENIAAAARALGWRKPWSACATDWAHLPYKGGYDLIHVDAGHTFIEAFTDIVIAWQRQPAVLLVDDYDFLPEVARAVHAFSEMFRLDFRYAHSFRGWATFEGAH
jgi:predicted O-methyltransferase YrrM